MKCTKCDDLGYTCGPTEGAPYDRWLLYCTCEKGKELEKQPGDPVSFTALLDELFYEYEVTEEWWDHFTT